MSQFLLGRIALCAAIAALSACGGSDASSTQGASAASVNTATSSSSSGTGSGQIATQSSASTLTAATTGATTTASTSTAATASTVAVSSTVKMSAATYSVAASSGTAVLSVERSGSSGSTSVQYSTANGSAVNGVDYTAASGNLTWTDGDTSIKKIYVPVDPKAYGKSFQVALSGSSTAKVSSPTAATVTITAPATVLPPAAEQAGYTMQTFGPAPTMGSNWYNFTFYGTSGAGGVNNSDGSLALSGQGSGAISSATVDTSKPNKWTGVAFGGGAYFEAVFSFTNADASALSKWPAFWASDIENMAAAAVTDITQWQGQPTGYGNWIETDFFEYDRSNVGQYGVQIHDWYGYHSHAQVQDVDGYTSGVHVPAGFDWAVPHKYGFLWVPATAHTQGYVQAYLDDVPMGPPVYWNQYDPKAPPAPSIGTTAFSVLDSRHLALIFDTGTHNPMTIQSVTVWQATAANNITE